MTFRPREKSTSQTPKLRRVGGAPSKRARRVTNQNVCQASASRWGHKPVASRTTNQLPAAALGKAPRRQHAQKGKHGGNKSTHRARGRSPGQRPGNLVENDRVGCCPRRLPPGRRKEPVAQKRIKHRQWCQHHARQKAGTPKAGRRAALVESPRCPHGPDWVGILAPKKAQLGRGPYGFGTPCPNLCHLRSVTNADALATSADYLAQAKHLGEPTWLRFLTTF